MTVEVRFGGDFEPVAVPAGTTLLAAAGRVGAPLGNACRAQGVCRACAVLVVSGGDLLEPANLLERGGGLESGWRMACQARVRRAEGQVVVWAGSLSLP